MVMGNKKYIYMDQVREHPVKKYDDVIDDEEKVAWGQKGDINKRKK